jgi:hypothetical protein
LGDKVHLEGADVVGAGQVGGASAMPHELEDASEVSLDGAWGVVAAGKFVKKALTQGSHEQVLRTGREETTAEGCQLYGQRANCNCYKKGDLLLPRGAG